MKTALCLLCLASTAHGEEPRPLASQNVGLTLGTVGRMTHIGLWNALPFSRGASLGDPRYVAASAGLMLVGDAFFIGALERDLQRYRERGLDASALRAGEVMSFGGAGLFGAGMALLYGSERGLGRDAGVAAVAIMGIGAGLQHLAYIPLGIQWRRTIVMRNQDPALPVEPSVTVQPFLDVRPSASHEQDHLTVEAPVATDPLEGSVWLGLSGRF